MLLLTYLWRPSNCFVEEKLGRFDKNNCLELRQPHFINTFNIYSRRPSNCFVEEKLGRFDKNNYLELRQPHFINTFNIYSRRPSNLFLKKGKSFCLEQKIFVSK
jgi:hypothetical protein